MAFEWPQRLPGRSRRRLKAAWYAAAPFIFRNPLALALRRRSIDGYLRTEAVPRANIGSGKYPKAGWLNFDLVPRHRGVLHADATEALPLPNASLAYVFTEHMIEHLPFPAIPGFLGEIARVLRPGGRVRIATPDLERMVALLGGGGDEEAYVDWVTRRNYPGAAQADPCFAVNAMFRFYGHQFIFTRSLLRRMVEAAGFVDVEFREVGESGDPNLADLEIHQRFIGDAFNRIETMVIEAAKPA